MSNNISIIKKLFNKNYLINVIYIKEDLIIGIRILITIILRVIYTNKLNNLKDISIYNSLDKKFRRTTQRKEESFVVLLLSIN